MSIYNQTFVYWIHFPEHTDMYSQGYVGVSNNPKRRLSEHKLSSKKGYKDNPFFGRILQKYEVIQTIIFCGSDIECYLKEETLRPEKNIGWNINKGGVRPPSMKGIPRTAITKKKISKSLKGHSVSDSTRDKISTNSKGKVITEEAKQKISKSLSGRKRSDEIKNKISNSNKGKKGISPSAETRAKLSSALKNRQFSEETRAKISSAKKEYWAIKRAQRS